ncbi:MAG: D-alanyl-D-alanine carboxypeptidase family protein [Huintestinicola sp.]
MKILRRILTLCIAAAVLPCGNVGAVKVETEDISAEAAIVIDADSGRVIREKNSKVRLPMASTTKIMTVLLTLESGDLDTEFVVDPVAVNTEGSSMGLKEGDIVSKRDLCIGMLLPSGNDAANCAAVRVGGDMESFVNRMNVRASELGLRSTHFVTPSGLHDDDHYSTARDMALLAAEAIRNPDFLEICSSQRMKLSFGNPPYDRWLTNTNKLLAAYEGCIGVKTGFTDEAGRCLVSAARRNGVTLICVTLHDPDDWNDHKKLLDYGFAKTCRRDVEMPVSFTADVAGGTADTVELVPAQTPQYTEIFGVKNNISVKINVPQMLYAPISEGTEAGYAVIYDGEREISRIPMKAAKSVPRKITEPENVKKPLSERITDFFKELLFANRKED